MTEPSRAVFLSYASQDAKAARRIADTLTAGGIEVWFDQSELRGGEAWDALIRRQIKTCALFIPIISANAHARAEGYFRLEWKLAVDRSHLIASDQPFLLPVVIDETPQTDERIPERFRELQWSRLPGGDTPPAFVERVSRLSSVEGRAAPTAAQPENVGQFAGGQRSDRSPIAGAAERGGAALLRLLPLALLAVIAVAVGYYVLDRSLTSRRSTTTAPATGAAPTAPATAFSPPPHSIAVLPFLNMSGDPKEEYFSDGLSEELLNSLSRVSALQVAARTSSFSFKGKNVDLLTIARQLGVGAVLEGSVRRSGRKVRVTAQLINAVTGFHIWSQTYDRDLRDVLALQTNVATAVTNALEVRLLSDSAGQIELGGTRNPRAFDAYLRAKAFSRRGDIWALHKEELAAYDEAIAIDPNFALAEVGRAGLLNAVAENVASTENVRATFANARAAAERAVALAPALGEAHARLSRVLMDGFFDFAAAGQEIERAVALAPGSVIVQREHSRYASSIGRDAVAIEAAHRAVTLDPLDARAYLRLGGALYTARRYDDAIPAYERVHFVDPLITWAAASGAGLVHLAAGRLELARISCAQPQDNWELQTCRTIVLHKLGKTQEAAQELTKMEKSMGDASAYQYAEIYAQWGQAAQALTWLAKAYELRDPGLTGLKTDPLLDPIRDTPQFKALERRLNFPS